MEKQKMDESVLDRARDLVNRQGSRYRRDVDDADMALSAMSGFGFDQKDRQFRGELKPEVTIPVLDTWINQTVAAYTAAPFGLGLKGQRDLTAERFAFDYVQEQNGLTDLVSSAFSRALTTGLSYMFVSSDVVDPVTGAQDVKIGVVDSRKVMCDADDDDEFLDTCTILGVVDVSSKKAAAAKFGIDEYSIGGTLDPLSGQNLEIDTRRECSILTLYEKGEGGVTISKIVGGKLVAQSTVAMSRIPWTRVWCDECWIEKKLHFRGVYHKVVGLWKMANYGMSEVQARIARAKQADWIVDPVAIARNPDAWAAGSDEPILEAASWNGEKELNAPMPVDKTLGLAEPLSAVQTVTTMITGTLGGVEAEGRSVETAEAVLARKATAEASTSKYLSNLKKSLKALGQSILEYIEICYDIPRTVDGVNLPPLSMADVQVTVDGGPAQATQRQKTLQQVILVSEMATKAGVPGVAAKILPTLVGMSDIPDEIKKQLQVAVSPAQEGLAPEVQQAMAAKDQQMAQLQQAYAESQKTVAALQQALFEMENDSRSKILMKQMDIEASYNLKRMEIANSDAQLQAQIVADAQAQTRKLQAELAKEIVKERQNTPDTPVFDKGRFV